MKIFFALTVVIFIAHVSTGQSYVKARTINFNPNTCNNTVVCEFYGLDYPHFVHYNAAPVFDGDTIENFCFYDFPTPGSNAIEYFGSNGYLSHYLGASGLITPDFNFTISSFAAPTDESSQDGSFIITFDSAVTSFTLNIFQDAYTPTITILDAYSLSISNLNLSYTSIYIQDPSDIYSYADFRVYAGNPTDLYINTGMDVNVSFQHAGISCSGWINLQANPPGTYYNAWSDDVSLTTTRTDLCPGVYGVYSYDLVSGYVNTGSIDTVVITNDSLTYIDTNLFSMIPQDTSYYFTTDCFFDYYQPIDSITYSEDTVFYSDPLLIATFDMNIYQGNNMITITDSLITLTDSTVLLDVVVYCTLFKAPFMGQRIMFLRGVENHFFVSPHLNTPIQQEKQSALIYPNPAQHEVNVLLENHSNYQIQIIDSQGKFIESYEIFNDNHLVIPTTNLESGIYFLLISSDDELQQYRFVKSTY